MPDLAAPAGLSLPTVDFRRTEPGPERNMVPPRCVTHTFYLAIVMHAALYKLRFHTHTPPGAQFSKCRIRQSEARCETCFASGLPRMASGVNKRILRPRPMVWAPRMQMYLFNGRIRAADGAWTRRMSVTNYKRIVLFAVSN